MSSVRTKRFLHWFRERALVPEQARGRDLDSIGDMLGFPRKRWWIFAWPFDHWYRRKLLAAMKAVL